MATTTPVKLAYKLVEPESGSDDSVSPIIFLHGMTGNKEHWRDITQIVANKTKRKVYAIDARNHGDSVYTNEFNFDMNVTDLLHFMDDMQISKAILVGHSMGGATAIRTALTQPEKVEKMISIDMHPKKLTQEVIQMISGMLSLFLKCLETIPKTYDIEEATTYVIDFIYSNIPPEIPAVLPPKDKMRILGTNLKQKSDGSYEFNCNMPVITEFLKNPEDIATDVTGEFDGPVVFLYGELSPFGVRQAEEDIKKLFPQAELVEIKGASHSPNFEVPELFLELLLKHL